jgi:endonuclease G
MAKKSGMPRFLSNKLLFLPGAKEKNADLNMAKFRTNHQRQGGASTSVLRFGLFAAVVGALFFVFNQFSDQFTPPEEQQALPGRVVVEPNPFDPPGLDFLPTSTTGQIIHHQHFSLSYVEEHEQAEWVAYILSGERLDMPRAPRPNQFLDDLKVNTGSATWRDYVGSGYDRGHLAPAADLAFDEAAIRESFYMSNVSPQARNFNAGIWQELEICVRAWAKRNKQLYVVTGPVLTLPSKGRIGKNQVAIPAAFYKVLLDYTEPQLKGIAFVLPNEVSYEPLFKYATTIAEVEKLTGIRFFPNLIPKEMEEELKEKMNIDLWPFNKSRYEERIKKWNTQAASEE